MQLIFNMISNKTKLVIEDEKFDINIDVIMSKQKMKLSITIILILFDKEPLIICISYLLSLLL